MEGAVSNAEKFLIHDLRRWLAGARGVSIGEITEKTATDLMSALNTVPSRVLPGTALDEFCSRIAQRDPRRGLVDRWRKS